MVYSLARPTGCRTAATCAQMEVTESKDETMFYGGRFFKTHCMAAADVGTSGNSFTRFWHYDGRKNGWPKSVKDVLKDAYGTCEDADACFQRLPVSCPTVHLYCK